MQIAVAEGEKPGIHPSLIALSAFLFQIHPPLRGDERLDIVGLLERFHAHVVVNHQVNMLKICTGKTVFGYLSNAAILGIAAKNPGEYRADLRLSFAAVALDDHHALSFIAGNQAVADVFLKSENVFRIQQCIEKAQPYLWRRRFRIVGNREAAADNLILEWIKGTVKQQRAVGQMNPVCSRREVFDKSRDFEQFNDVGDFLGDVGCCEVFKSLIDFNFERRIINHATIDGEEGSFREQQLVIGE